MTFPAAVFIWLVVVTAASGDAPCNQRLIQISADDTTPVGVVIASVTDLQSLDASHCVDQSYVNTSGNNITLARPLTGLCKDSLECSLNLTCGKVHTEVQLIVHINRTGNYTVKFTPDRYTASIEEGAAVGTKVNVAVSAAVEQCESGTAFPNPEYNLLQDGGGLFKWATQSKPDSLVVNGSLDYENETGRVYELTIETLFVIDNRRIFVRGNTTITVHVTDTDDNNPVFDLTEGEPTYQLAIPEQNTTWVNAPLTTTPPVHAYDPDTGINASIVYTIVKQDVPGLFVIDPASGHIEVRQTLDRENQTVYRVTLQASETARPTATVQALLEVTVTDVDDHRPVFSPATYTAEVQEFTYRGTFVTRVTATDADTGDNGKFTYVLLSWSTVFTIGNDGTIVVHDPRAIDRELNGNITIVVGTKTSSGAAGGNNATVTVRLLDINDNTPRWQNTSYRFHIGDTAIGTVVGQMVADDADDGPNSNVTYTITTLGSTASGCLSGIGGHNFPFDINPTDGTVFVSDSPVVCNTYTAVVEACDNPTTHTDRRCASTTLHLWYGNPQEVKNISQTMSVREDAPKDSYIERLKCTGDSYVYGSTEATPAFAIDTTTAMLVTRVPLDREHRDAYQAVITVRTAGQTTCMINVTVTVDDVNDNRPEFENDTYSFELPANVLDGSMIGKLTAVDNDIGANGQITYTMQNTGDRRWFSINESTGVLRVVSRADMTRDMYTVVVVAMDQGQPRMETPVTVHVILSATGGSNVTVSVPTPWTVTEVRHARPQLEQDISAILKYSVVIEKVEPVTVSNKSTRSRIWYSGTDTDGRQLSRDDLLSATLRHYESIRALFYGSDGTTDDHSDSGLGAPEIALIAMAVVILIGAVLAICVIFRQFNSHKRYKRLYDNLTKNSSMYESQELKVNVEDETSDYNGSVNTQDLEQPEQPGTPGLATATTNPVYGANYPAINHVTVNTGETTSNTDTGTEAAPGDTSMEEAIDSLAELSRRLEREEGGVSGDGTDDIVTGDTVDVIANGTGESVQTVTEIQRDAPDTGSSETLDHTYENTHVGDIITADDIDTSVNDNADSGSPILARGTPTSDTVVDPYVPDDEPNPDYDIKQVRFSHQVLDTDENKLEPLKIHDNENTAGSRLGQRTVSTKLSDMVESSREGNYTTVSPMAAFVALEPVGGGETRPKEVVDATAWAEDEINSPDNVVTVGEADTHSFYFGEDATTAL